jgi:hypothetical protein
MSPVTGVLREAWDLYGRFAGHFLAIAFVIYIAAAFVVAILTAFGGVAGEFVGVLINFIAGALVQSALVTAVQDVRDGRVDLDLRQTVSAALPFVLPVAAASVLAGIGIAVGFVLLIVPGLILLTFWSLIVPCIVIGRTGPIRCFGESWRTVRGWAWNVFGVYVLVFLMWIAFAFVVGLLTVVLPRTAGNFVSTVVTGTLVAPYLALVATLLYHRLIAAHQGEQAPWLGAPGTAA